MSDRRELIRDRLLLGYADTNGPGDPDRIRRHRTTYALLIVARSMGLFEAWYDQYPFPASMKTARQLLVTEFERLSNE